MKFYNVRWIMLIVLLVSACDFCAASLDISQMQSLSDVVIAVDYSNSTSDKDIREAALRDLKLLEDSNKINKVGLIIFNTTSIQIQTLISSFSDIKTKINTSTVSGNTCLGEGLIESRDILKDSKNSNRIIVFISDFDQEPDQCDKDQDVCAIARSIKDNGIKIIVDNIKDSDPQGYMKCIQSESLTEPKSESQTNMPVYNSTMGNEFTLKASSEISSYTDPLTNVTISKELRNTKGGLMILLTISTPQVKDIDHDLLFAIDSSGSMGPGGDPSYEQTIRRIMPEILKYIEDNKNIYGNVNVSIISWDNDIDFAYKGINPNTRNRGFGNRDILNASFVDISTAIADNTAESVFVYKGSGIVPLDPIINIFKRPIYKLILNGNIDPDPKSINNIYYCLEVETSDLNIPVISAKEILKQREKQYNSSEKAVILIVGRSEFKELSPTVVGNLTSQFPFYCLGLGVISESLLYSQLELLRTKTNGGHLDASGASEWTKGDFFTAIDQLKKLIRNATSKQYIGNISIADSLHPYLRIRKDEGVSARLSGRQIPIQPLYNNTAMMSDSEIDSIFIRDIPSMTPGSTLEISIPVKLSISLPQDVNSGASPWPFQNEIISKNRYSKIEYGWHLNKRSIFLPNNRFSIYS